MTKGLPAFLVIFLIIVFAVNLWALANSGYLKIWWLDMVLHFSGGFLTATFVFWFLFRNESNYFSAIPKWLVFLGIISFGTFIGVLWEFYEFGWDYFLAYPYGLDVAQADLTDTLSDLFFDLFGAVTSAFYFLYWHGRFFK